jgi:tetratricopeptide (TPR) repeat protein
MPVGSRSCLLLAVTVVLVASILPHASALHRGMTFVTPRSRVGKPAVRGNEWEELLLTLRGGDSGEKAVAEMDETTEEPEEGKAVLQAVGEDSDEGSHYIDLDERDLEEDSDEGLRHNAIDEYVKDDLVSTTESDQEEEDGEQDVIPEDMPAVVETTVVQHHDIVDFVENPSQDVSEDSDREDDSSEGSSSDEEETAGDVTTSTEESELTEEEVETLIEIASQIRIEGKNLHDKGQFVEAAARFSSAADLLSPTLSFSSESGESGGVADDFATCRLHEALCLLKAEDYEEAMRACTDVLDSPLLSSASCLRVAPALRARAFHRRAKAQVELGNEAAALQDARSAAFLGDQKAVALYGKLMRESSGPSWSGDTGDMGDMATSGALLESLLNKSSGPGAASAPMGDMGDLFSPSSLLNMMGAGAPSAGGGPGKSSDSGKEGAGSLAKSVLSSLVKRLEDESTQNQICNFLKGTSGPQIQQMASLAGLQIEDSIANRLARFGRGVTPKTLRRTLRTTKVVIYTVQLIRKVFQLISKYRSIIILIFLVGWIKSAILRPLPVNKRAMRLAAKAADAVAAM